MRSGESNFLENGNGDAHIQEYSKTSNDQYNKCLYVFTLHRIKQL